MKRKQLTEEQSEALTTLLTNHKKPNGQADWKAMASQDPVNWSKVSRLTDGQRWRIAMKFRKGLGLTTVRKTRKVKAAEVPAPNGQHFIPVPAATCKFCPECGFALGIVNKAMALVKRLA